MGSQCCSEQDDINPRSKKLIRACYINIISSQSIKSNKSNKGGNNNQGVIRIYDVENQTSNTFPVKFCYFKNLDSVTQISAGNYLYLCGEQGSFDSGSAMIRFDLASPVKVVSILVNSIYRHYLPSMTIFKKDFIVTVGGKFSVNSEIFHRVTNKWRKLPDIPEERYGAGLINDDKSDVIYCFGGYNHSEKKFCKSILKLNLKTGIAWETIVLIKNSSILARNFFSVVKPTNSDCIYFLGGQTEHKEATTDIISYDFSNKIAILQDYNLESSIEQKLMGWDKRFVVRSCLTTQR